MTSTSRTARCGPAYRVVWQGRSLTAAPYADLPLDAQDAPGERGQQLELAHQMAAVLLNRRASMEDRTPYNGPNREVLWLPQGTAGRARTQLMLVDIDVETIAAVAEIAAALRCELAPNDGDPAVAADAEALVLDVTRRALRRVLPPEKSLYETACAAGVDELAEAE